ncbi:MAG: tetratricopeptide repeat protein [Deltaproteobacteria bacterium]|nr:tetratricopeptide repeat protein [Deltaproteobacteria bacterium]
MPQPIRLGDAFKGYTFDLDKLVTPEETIALVRERLGRLDLRILKDTVRIDSGRLDIPVYISRVDVDAMRVMPTRKQMGKGATPAQAEASALMELMERFSFFSFLEEGPLTLSTAREVGDGALPFDYLRRSLFDDSPEAGIAAGLYPDWPLFFAPATNLTTGAAVQLPFHWFYLIEEYNGPAAGNCREEALLQGICEVVERHVGSVISHDRRPTPVIDPDSATDPAVQEMLGKFRKNGIKLFVRDFTMDMGIPSVGVLAYDPATFPQQSEIVFTVGTTTSPEKSLSRALSEVAQLAGDFHQRTSYRPTLPKYAGLEEAAYLMTDGPAIPLRSLPDVSHENLAEEIRRCLRALSARGLEVLAVETTHPRLEVPAVYVLIPGTHFLERTRHTNVVFHLAKTAALYAPPPAARQALARLGATFPRRFDVEFFQGVTLENLEMPGEALGHFQKALDLNPPEHEVASIYVHLGSCRKDLGQYDEAAAHLLRARELNPALKEAHHLLGFCHFKKGEYEQAVSCFERAIELDPGSGIDYANLGVNLARLGHAREAAYVLRQALELDPSLEFARQVLTEVEGGKG